MKQYMLVTDDKYELPVAIADTITELARITGKNRKTIASVLSRKRKDTYGKSIYVEVDLDDEE